MNLSVFRMVTCSSVRAGLKTSLEIMQAFPTAGLVSVQPCLFDVLQGEAQAQHHLKMIQRYRLSSCLPDPGVVEEYGHGIGMEFEDIEALKQKPVPVVEETRTGVRAIDGPIPYAIYPAARRGASCPAPAGFACPFSRGRQKH